MKYIAVNFLSFIFISHGVLADDSMAVDDADDFNPQVFHETKTDEIKLYDANTGTFFGRDSSATVKTYPQDSIDSSTVKASVEPQSQRPKKNQNRFDIRVLYSIASNNKGLATAGAAIQQLHQQMAHHCPQGWSKQKEWSIAEGEDYFLHYEFQCL